MKGGAKVQTNEKEINPNEKLIQEMRASINANVKGDRKKVELDEKVKKFFEALDEKASINCKKQIDELKKYEETASSDKQEDKANVDRALKDFEECRSNYLTMFNNFMYISQFTRQLFKMQADYCYSDCEKANSDQGKLKECLDLCNMNAEKYIFRAATELLGSTVDNFKNELNKL